MNDEAPAHRCNGNPTPHHGTSNKCTICGEYRNGWFDPVSGLEVVSESEIERLAAQGTPAAPADERDKALIESVAEPWICVEDKPCEETTPVHWEELLAALNGMLATVRAEEREAAFKALCVECADGDMPELDQMARWFYHNNRPIGCSASKLRIAALEIARGKVEG